MAGLAKGMRLRGRTIPGHRADTYLKRETSDKSIRSASIRVHLRPKKYLGDRSKRALVSEQFFGRRRFARRFAQIGISDQRPSAFICVLKISQRLAAGPALSMGAIKLGMRRALHRTYRDALHWEAMMIARRRADGVLSKTQAGVQRQVNNARFNECWQALPTWTSCQDRTTLNNPL
jgi:hypothetical protein